MLGLLLGIICGGEGELARCCVSTKFIRTPWLIILVREGSALRIESLNSSPTRLFNQPVSVVVVVVTVKVVVGVVLVEGDSKTKTLATKDGKDSGIKIYSLANGCQTRQWITEMTMGLLPTQYTNPILIRFTPIHISLHAKSIR